MILYMEIFFHFKYEVSKKKNHNIKLKLDIMKLNFKF